MHWTELRDDFLRAMTTTTPVSLQGPLGQGLTYGSQGLAIVGAFGTGWRLGSSLDQSFQQGTATPILQQGAQEAGGWGGAWVGFMWGGTLGIESGPGALATGLAGALVGGWGGSDLTGAVVKGN